MAAPPEHINAVPSTTVSVTRRELVGPTYLYIDCLSAEGRCAAMAAPNAQFMEIGPAFVTHYYQQFDTNRPALQSLYQDSSMLTFEKEQFMGMQAIMTKLTTLAFQTVQHQVTTIDCQPTLGNAISVFVTGKLVVDGSPNALMFAQTFVLGPTAEGSWYIHNDMFRLNYT